MRALLAEGFGLAPNIDAKRRKLIVTRRLCPEKVAREGGRKAAVVPSKPGLIGRYSPIKRFGHDFDARTHTEVAHAHLPQIVIHVVEHRVEQALRKVLRRRPFRAQTAEKQKDVEGHHVEPAVQTVGHAETRIERRQPGLGHRMPVEGICRILNLTAFLSIYQWHRNISLDFGLTVRRAGAILNINAGCRQFGGRLRLLLYDAEGEMQQPSVHNVRGAAVARVFGAALLALGLVACTPHPKVQGNVVDPQLLQQVKPGAMNKDQVQSLLGTPSSVATFDQNTWYYISKQTQRIAFLDPEVLDQKVIVVEFDKKGVVKAIHKYGEQDGKDVQIVSRTTPTRGKAVNVLDQIMYTLLRQFGNGGNASSVRDPFNRH